MTARTREQRLHDMTQGERHYALRWLCDHRPDVFDQVADVVDRARARAARVARTQARRTLGPFLPGRTRP